MRTNRSDFWVLASRFVFRFGGYLGTAFPDAPVRTTNTEPRTPNPN
jgi:hypothetical protein